MRVLLLILLLIIISVVALVIYTLALRRRLNGLDDPVLWLPRKERREYARSCLKREQDQYELQRQQDLIDTIHQELRKRTSP